MRLSSWKSLRLRLGRDPNAPTTPLDYARSPEALRPGNEIDILRCGREAYPAMLAAIAGAKRFVLFETFTWQDDSVGRAFRDALIERAEIGIDVFAVYDAVGSFGLSDEFVEELEGAGVHCVAFHPIAPWRPRWGFNQRDHQKILVVDGQVGFTGGINVSEEYAPAEEGGGGWLDMHARVRGPVVHDLERLVRRTWRKATGKPLPIDRRRPAQAEDEVAAETGVLARTIDNFGLRNRSRMRAAYIHAIRASHSRISLMNPYFIPDSGLRRAFRRAAQNGVDVRVIVPANSDVRVVEHASRFLYPGLIRAGVRIFEWPESMMHAKTGVIDGVWSTIGSYNIDRRSFFHNLEASLVIVDEEFAGRMQDYFDADVAQCHEVTLEDCSRTRWWEQLMRWVCYLFRHWL